MRTPESKIKAAILHPEEEIRLDAVEYFALARCEDVSVMPLVIQAVEKYGQAATAEILHGALRLPQTEASVDWITDQLRRDYDLSDVVQENHCIYLAWILFHTSPPLFAKRFNDFIATPGFPKPLRRLLKERLDTFAWDWDRGWAALKYYALDTQQHGFDNNAHEWGDIIVESLARQQQTDKVLALLQGQHDDEDPCLMCRLRPRIVEMAGEMRLTAAVPLLMELFHTMLSCGTRLALAQIGGDAVLEEIDARWRRGGREFRRWAARLLEKLRGDNCAERCLAYFQQARDKETKLTLAEALLENFCEDAVDPISRYLVDVSARDCRRREFDLRYRMVATATIMGRTFPQFDRWRKLALRDNWGQLDSPPHRMANSYKPEQFGPKWSEN